MPQSDKQRTLTEIGHRRISAILRTDDTEVARRAMRAAVDGGFRVIEFTLTTPGAIELIAEFAAEAHLVVGAGTVLTIDQVRQCVAAGARFIVSPVFDPAVIEEANALGAVSIPGTFTPTEMLAAQQAGADLLKLFPLPGMGPEYITSVLGPLPFLRLFPTCGVTPRNFLDFLRAGAFGVGFTNHLFTPEDLRNRAFQNIHLRAAGVHHDLAHSPFAPPPSKKSRRPC
jgi:2-dehydro-3-deoxyphosphogluconate aldolase/(4S)-4-hydroxy-2-oxoglutarate aldolase